MCLKFLPNGLASKIDCRPGTAITLSLTWSYSHGQVGSSTLSNFKWLSKEDDLLSCRRDPDVRLLEKILFYFNRMD